MKIVECYSHLGGLEILMVHRPQLWTEIQDVIKHADAAACRTKVSKEIRSKGNLLYSPPAMNKAIRSGFEKHDWAERRISYWVTTDARLIRKTLFLPSALPFRRPPARPAQSTTCASFEGQRSWQALISTP